MCVLGELIAPDKAFFQSNIVDIILITPGKHVLWVLNRGGSLRHF